MKRTISGRDFGTIPLLLKKFTVNPLLIQIREMIICQSAVIEHIMNHLSIKRNIPFT